MWKVKATALGFLGGKLRYPGDEFKIEKSQFSEVWMEVIEKPRRGRPKTKKGE